MKQGLFYSNVTAGSSIAGHVFGRRVCGLMAGVWELMFGITICNIYFLLQTPLMPVQELPFYSTGGRTHVYSPLAQMLLI